MSADAYDPKHLPGATAHDHHSIDNRCPVCGKVVYPTWEAARFDAQRMRRHKDAAHHAPYWSRECRAIHVGGGLTARRNISRHDRRPMPRLPNQPIADPPVPHEDHGHDHDHRHPDHDGTDRR